VANTAASEPMSSPVAEREESPNDSPDSAGECGQHLRRLSQDERGGATRTSAVA
jgi:hypothetical protein